MNTSKALVLTLVLSMSGCGFDNPDKRRIAMRGLMADLALACDQGQANPSQLAKRAADYAEVNLPGGIKALRSNIVSVWIRVDGVVPNEHPLVVITDGVDTYGITAQAQRVSPNLDEIRNSQHYVLLNSLLGE